MLLGSDYTQGVKGVGIVNASEIVSTFGGKLEHEDMVGAGTTASERPIKGDVTALVATVAESGAQRLAGDTHARSSALKTLTRFRRWIDGALGECVGSEADTNSILRKNKDGIISSSSSGSSSSGNSSSSDSNGHGGESSSSSDASDDENCTHDSSVDDEGGFIARGGAQATDRNSNLKGTKARNCKSGAYRAKRNNKRAARVAIFSKKHATQRLTWRVADGFPDPVVIDAYLRPEVNRSSERFSWQTPKLEALRLFCSTKLGMPQARADQTLMPLMALIRDDADAAEAAALRQARLDSFYLSYHDNSRVARIRSSRLRSAVGAMLGAKPAEVRASKPNGKTKKCEPTASTKVKRKAVGRRRQKRKQSNECALTESACAMDKRPRRPQRAAKRKAAASLRDDVDANSVQVDSDTDT